MNSKESNKCIHPLSDVQSKNICEKTNIWLFTVVLPEAKIGSNCNICAQIFIENDVVIGNDVTIKNGVQLWDGTRISDKVFIGPNVTFTNDLYPRSKQYPDIFDQITIEEGASIGANATIVGGSTIGAYSLVGAGAVIIKDIPMHTVWVGNPGKQIGYISKSGKRYSMEDSKTLTNFNELLHK